MLKKAGIVVAAAAATLLSVSPLAFAGDNGDDHGYDGGSDSTDVAGIDRSAEGLVNLSGNNLAAPINACHNQIPVNVLGVQVPLNNTTVQVSDILGGLGLGVLGDGEGKDKDAGDTVSEQNCDAEATGDSVDD